MVIPQKWFHSKSLRSIRYLNSVGVSQFCEQIHKTVSTRFWFWWVLNKTDDEAGLFWLKWFARQCFCDEHVRWLIFRWRHQPISLCDKTSRHKSRWLFLSVITLYRDTGHKIKKTIWQRRLGMSALRCSLRRQTAVDVRFTHTELKLLHPSAPFKSTRLLQWKQ